MKIGPFFVANLAQWGVKTNVLSMTKLVPLCLKWNFLPEPFWTLIIYLVFYKMAPLLGHLESIQGASMAIMGGSFSPPESVQFKVPNQGIAIAQRKVNFSSPSNASEFKTAL